MHFVVLSQLVSSMPFSIGFRRNTPIKDIFLICHHDFLSALCRYFLKARAHYTFLKFCQVDDCHETR